MRILPPVCLLCLLVTAATAEEAATIESRLGRSVRYLSSDELGGRGLGTPGIDKAADYLRQEFEAIGLKTDAVDGGPYQHFDIVSRTILADGATASLVSGGDDTQTLVVGETFNPLALGGSGEFDLPLAFVGYGITAPEADYDDYDGIDVAGKAVIILRHEPQQANPHSKFNGAENSEHAPFLRKLASAADHGAAAVVFVTDQHEIDKRTEQTKKRIAAAEEELADEATPEKRRVRVKRLVDALKSRLDAARDPLLGFMRAGSSSGQDLPVLCITRGPLDRLLQAAGKPTLAELEKQIDNGPTPTSFALDDCRLKGSFSIERRSIDAKNVIGVLPGEGPLAREAIVIGAHYDHIGRGGAASRSPGSKEIHNGADDNASGSAALLETARGLASLGRTLPRTIVFVAFTGEERGLLGSAEYVRNPVVPMKQTVAMLNFDMVGRLTDNKLIVNGTGTAEEFSPWLDELNEKYGFDLEKSSGGYGPSDHSSFYAKQRPVLHFFTGLHDEYHRPDDDFDLVQIEGMRRITELVVDMAVKIADAPKPVAYVAVEQPRMAQGSGDPRPYFGSIPDFASPPGGYGISGVAPKSPAALGGLKGGDKIIKLGEHKITNLEDFDRFLRKFTAGEKVKIVVSRDDKEVELEVTLDEPR